MNLTTLARLLVEVQAGRTTTIAALTMIAQDRREIQMAAKRLPNRGSSGPHTSSPGKSPGSTSSNTGRRIETNMMIQIETLTLADGSKVAAVLDIEKVKQCCEENAALHASALEMRTEDKARKKTVRGPHWPGRWVRLLSEYRNWVFLMAYESIFLGCAIQWYPTATTLFLWATGAVLLIAYLASFLKQPNDQCEAQPPATKL